MTTGQNETTPVSVSGDETGVKNTIPVICNAKRFEDRTCDRNPRNIFLNPKFFNQGPSNQPISNGPLHHEFRPARFDNFHRFEPRPFNQMMTPNFPMDHPQMMPRFNGPRYEHAPFHHRPPNPFQWRAESMWPQMVPNNFVPGPSLPMNPYVNPPMQPYQENYYPPYVSEHVHGPPRLDFDGSFKNRHGIERRRMRRSRTRSRSRSPSYRCRSYRSSSESSYCSSQHRRRRSRHVNSPHESRTSHKSSGSLSDSPETNENLWDSDAERNSDFDLDLSNQLESLTVNVCDSKLLLKEAIKCLGSEKIKTMIPLELTGVNRNLIFKMCEKLLNETDSEVLVKVMEGSYHLSMEKEESSASESKSLQDRSSSEETSSSTARKIRKKKSKKRKRKKKKKVSESESSEDVEENESTSDDPEGSKEVPKGGLAQPGAPASVTQQSLLELIQIEYKTKAINVMLKHLGVANEINNMVSNALQNNALSVEISTTENVSNPQPPSAKSQEKITSDVINDILSIPSTEDKTDGNILTDLEAGDTSKLQESEKVTIDKQSDFSERQTIELEGQGEQQSDDQNVQGDDAELLNVVYEDVLDIAVSANDKLDLFD